MSVAGSPPGGRAPGGLTRSVPRLSWSGLPALGACRGSRPSSLPRALELVDSWILGTSPRLTEECTSAEGRLPQEAVEDELAMRLGSGRRCRARLAGAGRHRGAGR